MSKSSNTPNLNSNQSIQSLTVGELESLIKTIVKETLQEEIAKLDFQKTQKFLETFGSWEDSRTADEIIDEIYYSRGLKSEKL